MNFSLSNKYLSFHICWSQMSRNFDTYQLEKWLLIDLRLIEWWQHRQKAPFCHIPFTPVSVLAVKLINTHDNKYFVKLVLFFSAAMFLYCFQPSLMGQKNCDIIKIQSGVHRFWWWCVKAPNACWAWIESQSHNQPTTHRPPSPQRSHHHHHSKKEEKHLCIEPPNNIPFRISGQVRMLPYGVKYIRYGFGKCKNVTARRNSSNVDVVGQSALTMSSRLIKFTE